MSTVNAKSQKKDLKQSFFLFTMMIASIIVAGNAVFNLNLKNQSRADFSLVSSTVSKINSYYIKNIDSINTDISGNNEDSSRTKSIKSITDGTPIKPIHESITKESVSLKFKLSNMEDYDCKNLEQLLNDRVIVELSNPIYSITISDHDDYFSSKKSVNEFCSYGNRGGIPNGTQITLTYKR